jgi:hypothetical protein
MSTTSRHQTPVPERNPSRRLHPVHAQLLSNSVDFILTDPPYLVRYRDRENRSIQNDSNGDWVKPAFAEAHRLSRRVVSWFRSTAELRPTSSSMHGVARASELLATWSSASNTPRRHVSCSISTSRHT